ncbi:MAG: NAD(P)H-hydrate dehydratase [Waddliaceae bacterium]
MKVVSSKQMADLESRAYRNGSSERDFMEEAGKGVAELIDQSIIEQHLPRHVTLLCGKGNNAGDAFVAGVHLLDRGYTILAYPLVPIHQCSPLCQQNQARFLSKGGLIQQIENVEELDFPPHSLIVDALFGTGFHGTAREPYAAVIKKANQSSNPIVSIDIPSGLEGDSGIVEGEAIHAAQTIFLGLPKTGFFLQDGWNHVGKLRSVDFGLPSQYIEEFEADLIMLTPEMIRPLFPKIVNNRHKYQAGYVIGLAGSPGMPGAALLSSIAALRSGAGIVRLLYPKGMETELSSSPCELIKTAYDEGKHAPIIEAMNTAAATFIGPGIGRTASARDLLKNILPRLTQPRVVDADALTIIAEENIAIPEKTILTPHVGEMMRFFRQSTPKPSSREFLHMCQDFVEKREVTLVLKGGPSFIFHPGETMMVNPYGDPGMATAGSGDVLTGIIAALLAQELSPHHAAILGVSLHGVSGECAAKEKTSYCLIAGDIVHHLPDAFQRSLCH